MPNSDIQILELNAGDLKSFKALIQLFKKVFESEEKEIPSDLYLSNLLQDTNFIVLALLKDKTIIGGITAFEIKKYSSEISELFIYDLAIDSAFQRKGLGQKLIQTIIEKAKNKGISEVFVAASGDDQHAINFYQKSGGNAEKVIHFTYNTNQ